MSANGSLPLAQVRAAAAAALTPSADDDPTVLVDLVDAVQPPALMLEWNDPWLELETVAGGRGFYYARLNVLCIAGRLEPGPGISTLEQLLSYTLTRLQADAYSWPLAFSQAPRRFDINNIPLLGARLGFRVAVSLEGGT